MMIPNNALQILRIIGSRRAGYACRARIVGDGRILSPLLHVYHSNATEQQVIVCFAIGD